MFKQYFALLGILFFVNCSAQQLEEEVSQSSPVLFGDPFILNNDSVYYLYGTQAENGIQVYKSYDLKTWTGPCGATNGLALFKDDVYGSRWFWAPEVYALNGEYYMFFSVEEHIAVATSNSPLGPFVQDEKKVLFTNKSIDNHLFIDDEIKYMYYVNFQSGGLESWCVEMNDDLLSVKEETALKCIGKSQEWEFVEGSVNEGPFVIKHEDYYYMVYSGNGYTSQNYGLGFAVSKSPQGPWTKHPENPILQKPGDLVGVGHCSLFYDRNQALKVVYHSHFDKNNIHPRKVHISDVYFKPDVNYDYKVMEVDIRNLGPLMKDN